MGVKCCVWAGCPGTRTMHAACHARAVFVQPMLRAF
ncbi:hypothetical protein Ttaiw_01306 [Tepidimonas taiwanensis]|uniref:Uncharacterized protein n=1 Tax=Tepidimonas taiwanensis TaxID=307486 RepID=A0A554X7T1_9BURK|nr:hypothetical protein Ttaiw_01306 [Tepidimonas taiwanensis]